MAGTAGAQIITFASAPVLTRVFDPTHFGVFAVYMAAVAIAATAGAFAYDMATPIPSSDREAARLLVLSQVLLVLVALVVSLLCWGFRDVLLPGLPHISGRLFAMTVFLGVLLAGLYHAGGYLLLRSVDYATVSRSRIVQSVAMAGGKISIGLAGASGTAMILGYLVGMVGGLVPYHRHLRMALRRGVTSDLSDYWVVARQYSRFPIFQMPIRASHRLFEGAIVFVMVSFFGAATAGLYALSKRALNTPGDMVGESLRKVYYATGARQFERDVGGVVRMASRGVLRTLLVTAPFIAAIVLLAPALFGFMFGSEWTEAGTFAQALAGYVVTGIALKPVVAVLPLLKLEQLHLSASIARGFLMAASAAIAGAMGGGPIAAVWAMSVAGAVVNITLIMWWLLRVERGGGLSRLESRLHGEELSVSSAVS
jgi:lipopolysaccharide exporter